MTAKKEGDFPDTYLPDISDGVSQEAVCEPMGTNHIRLDKIKRKSGQPIPLCTPYTMRVRSDVSILCRYTRVDASLPAHTLMTAMEI